MNQGFKICSSDDENGIFSCCEHRQEVLDFFQLFNELPWKTNTIFPFICDICKEKMKFYGCRTLFNRVSVHLLENF